MTAAAATTPAAMSRARCLGRGLDDRVDERDHAEHGQDGAADVDAGGLGVTGLGHEPQGARDGGEPPAILTATLSPGEADDPRRLLAHLVRECRLLAERAAVGWQSYRDGAAMDPDIAADWQEISEMRRAAFRVILAQIPASALRPGLSPAVAADIAWAIASPETHHQLVREAGYSYDQPEAWVRTTLSAALFPDQ